MNPIEALESSRHSGVKTTLSAIRDLQRLLPEYDAEPRRGMIYGEQIKYVSWRFDPKRFSSIELLHLTDLQFGHVECRMNKWMEYQKWVLSRPNRFVLLGGDMIDASTVLSPGEPWENLFNPSRQVFKFCEAVAPMRHRILGYVGGNHERRGIKTFGDLGQLIASLLCVPYSGGVQFVDIHYGGHKPYQVFLHHGKGAAQTKGAKTQMLYRMTENYPGSDLYLVGHLHDSVLLPLVRLVHDHEKCIIGRKKYYAGMSSSFLDFMGTYAEVAAMTINDIFMLRAVLEPTGKVEVTIR